ncbi:MAG: FtsQ-type POTRA domain-containing protein [Oscillospiraceae bacterium]|nr:FtsQ-type POTRA domain-containing protein [Oscillospiraceae bacterium]
MMNEKTPVRKKRSFRGGNYILYYLFAAIVVAVVLAVLSNTVLFRCTEIEVVGNVGYTPEQIITGSELKMGDNLLHIDAKAAAKKVVDICLFVDEAEVRKSFPTKLIISVKEAEVCFCVFENGKTAGVSRGGRVIKFLDSPGNAIILKGFEPESLELGTWLKSKNETKTALPWEMLEIMEEAKLTKITEIDISDRYSPKVLIDNRILLNLGGATELESKFLVAKALIDTQIGANESVIISLSNPEKPAVRPNNNNSAQYPPDDIGNDLESNTENSTSD